MRYGSSTLAFVEIISFTVRFIFNFCSFGELSCFYLFIGRHFNARFHGNERGDPQFLFYF